ncbi:MAG TPA: hypothetical protein V6D17_08915 [Candidatus Obscuribacterales bacterium]
MVKVSPRTVWMGVLLGFLVATAPNWLFDGSNRTSQYDAPWIYPGNLPK